MLAGTVLVKQAMRCAEMKAPISHKQNHTRVARGIYRRTRADGQVYYLYLRRGRCRR